MNVLIPKDILKANKGKFIKKYIAFEIKKEVALKGHIVWDGLINDKEEVYGIESSCEIQGGTDGKFNEEYIFHCPKGRGLLVKKEINFLNLNYDGTVKGKSRKDMLDGKGIYSKGECVSVNIVSNIKYGKIINVGKINNIICYEIEFNPHGAGSNVIVIEEDIRDNEVKDPIELNVHVYFKKDAFVELSKDLYGVVRKYIACDNIFYYLVETDMGVSRVGLKDIRYGLDIDLQDKAFLTIDDPENYGIVTTLKKGSVVQLINKKSHGHISWMGFDGSKEFKFGLTLEERNGSSDDGTFYKQTLFTAKKGCAALVSSFEVAPDGRFPQEEKKRTEPTIKSEIEESYQQIINTIELGDRKGIQGNSNSCYMDTSIFAMFAFNNLFDSIITEDVANADVKRVQLILRKNIVYPLRKYKYVSYDKVAEFRKELQNIVPNSKFVMDERDPEELIETLFHLLTPKLFLLRTKCFFDVFEQKCFLTQLFYQHDSKDRNLNVQEMLTLTFLESKMLILKPPKALILQLPRHGRDLKRFKTVKILPTMDITPLIAFCHHRCKKCSKEVKEINLCLQCSLVDYKMIYYCKDHLKECDHNKESMNLKDRYNGSVELELIAILCIERTHYIAYTKTNETPKKWIYFNSMERLDDGEFIPHLRETPLDRYFNGKEKFDDHLYNSDVEKIENYAFVCFYKNTTMEMYKNDFNSD